MEKGKKYLKPKNILEKVTLLRRSLIFQTKEFFQNSTLHGVRYIAESGRPLGEKFMWFCFTAVGAVTALIIIMSLWEKFQTNPTITGLDTDYQNQKVIFPSTVVCPETAFDRKKAYDVAYRSLAAYDHNMARQIAPFLELLTSLSFENIQAAYDMSQMFTSTNIDDRSLRAWAFQVHTGCEDTLVECKYRDEKIKCCSHFDPIYTEHGFCYAFNSRFISTADSDQPAPSAHDLYETDKKWALQFVPNSTSKIYIFSQEEYFGEDIKSQLEWKENQSVEVRILKRSTYTTDDARQLTIGQRKCIFSDEVKLSFFHEEYTFTACMKDCRMKKSIKLCKCIPSFYKPVPYVPTCKISQLPCLQKYATNITNIKDCLHCELGCSQTVYNIEKLNKNYGNPEDQTVIVEFLTWPIICFKREVLFGWVDLLVSFGGIASLFLGFSLLSGVEILYYFTMRACCMVYRNRDELYKIEEDIKRRPPPLIHMSLVPRARENESNEISIIQDDKLKKQPEVSVGGTSNPLNRRRHEKVNNNSFNRY
ncbi:sodium channel protein Nach [Episyrphus balteatus]|uniref:sodium channel protein Nach n=1 Tax=Episyrphus balteatus TaxID=286459 RepID=UPI0024861B9B|nr:sodium channel protein Nach [Episyrphus balteatus]